MSLTGNKGSSSGNSSQQFNNTSTSTPNNLAALQTGWNAAGGVLTGQPMTSATDLLTGNANAASSAANNGLTTASNYATPGATNNPANTYLTPFANGSMTGNNPYFQNLVNQLSQSVQGSTDGGFAAAGRYGSGANANAFNTALTNEAGQLGYANYNQSLQNQLGAADQLSTNNTSSTNLALQALGLIPNLSSASTGAGSSAIAAAAAPATTYANILSLLGSGGGTVTNNGTSNGQYSGKTSSMGFNFAPQGSFMGIGFGAG